MKLKPRIVEVKVPLLTGEESLMTIKRWLVAIGEPVEIDQDLVELDIDDTESFRSPPPWMGN